MSQHLIEKIQSYIELEEEDRRFIQSAFKPRRYAKGEHFLLTGDVCREAAFVERGVFRFYINLESEEATYYFSAENEFICDYPSFLRQTASGKNIQALEAAEIYAISHNDLQAFYRKVRFGERFGRMVAEEILLIQSNSFPPFIKTSRKSVIKTSFKDSRISPGVYRSITSPRMSASNRSL